MQAITSHRYDFRLIRRAAIILVLMTTPTFMQLSAQPAGSSLEDPCSPARGSSGDSERVIRLESGKPVSHALESKTSDTYCISPAPGQHGVVTLGSKGVRVKVQLLEVSGTLIVDWIAPEQIDIVVPKKGAYLLKVLPEYSNHPATLYELGFTQLGAASDSDEALFDAHRLSTLVHSLNNEGKFADALKTESKAVQRAEQAGPAGEGLLAQLLADLGWLQSRAGDSAEAEKSFNRSLEIVQRDPDRRMQQSARAHGGMGVMYARKEDYGRAEENLEEALEINRRLYGDDHPAVASCLEDLVMMREARGDHQRALAEIQRAIAIDEKALGESDPAFIRMLGGLAGVYVGMGDYDAAQPVLERQLRLVQSTLGPSHPFAGSALMEMGRIARKRKNFARALDYDWQAEKIEEQTYGPRHPAVGLMLNNIGNVYESLGDHPHALDAFQRSLGILEDSVGPDNERTVLVIGNLARIYTRLGDMAHALEFLQRLNASVDRTVSYNLVVASERERLAYIETYSDAINEIIAINLQKAPGDQSACDLAALAILQRKGRVQDASSDVMASVRRHLMPEDQSLLDNLTATTTSLAKVSLSGGARSPAQEKQQQINSLQEKREKLEIEIARQSRGYYQSGEITLEAVKAAVPTDAALVEFVVYRPYSTNVADIEPNGDPRYAVYVISHDRNVEVRDLGSKKEIDEGVRAFTRALRRPESRDFKELAQSLDARIFRPVRALAGEKRRWILSPDGNLNFLPFEALVDENGHFLIRQHLITYVTTGRDLLRMQVARPSQSAPLIVANPLFGDRDTQNVSQNGSPPLHGGSQHRGVTVGDDLSQLFFAPLSGTALEASQIKALFPDARILTGLQASKAALEKVDAPSILHVATHGFFLMEEQDGKASGQKSGRITNPLLRSGLALAGANLNSGGDDNGILTALEAASLNLWGTKLVTLSACDTGVGEVKSGEGVYGLRRAFLLAGAQTVVTSLWPVSDYATRRLMTNYYNGLRNGEGRGEALRKAQLAMLGQKGRAHPFFWAGFVQFGDWTSLNGN